MTKWGGTGWGSWHAGPEAGVTACPQGDGLHTTAEAVALNSADRDRRRASLRAAEARWLQRGLDVQKRP